LREVSSQASLARIDSCRTERGMWRGLVLGRTMPTSPISYFTLRMWPLQSRRLNGGSEKHNSRCHSRHVGLTQQYCTVYWWLTSHRNPPFIHPPIPGH